MKEFLIVLLLLLAYGLVGNLDRADVELIASAQAVQLRCFERRQPTTKPTSRLVILASDNPSRDSVIFECRVIEERS